MLTSKQKPKLKAKGHKLYQNTNGKIKRVKSKPKALTQKMIQKMAKHQAEN